MKSEERHQLLQNDLQVVTNRTVGFAERHLPTVIAVVCVVALIAVVAVVWTNTTDTSSAAGWTSLDTAKSLEDLGDVADKYKGKPPGQWAQLQISEKTLQAAMPLMFSSREIALADLKRAREGFETLLKDTSSSPLIRERSLWGLALCLETSCDGDVTKPVEAYQRLTTEFPETPFKTVAEQRIQALKRGDSGEFYAWFSKENPKPPEIRPRDGGSRTNPLMPDDDPFGGTDPKNEPDFKSEVEGKTKKDPGDAKPEGDQPIEKVEDGKDADAKGADKPTDGDKPPGTDAPKDGDKPTDKQ